MRLKKGINKKNRNLFNNMSSWWQNISYGKKIFVLCLGTITVCFIINLMMYLPMPSVVGADNWLGFYGSLFGAVIGGIITMWGVQASIKSTMINVKPLIVPIKTMFYIYSKDNKYEYISQETNEDIIDKHYNEEYIDHYVIEEAFKEIFFEKAENKILHALNIENIWEVEERLSELCLGKKCKEFFELLEYKLQQKLDYSTVNNYIYKLKKLYSEKFIKHFLDRKRFSGQRYLLPIYNVGTGNALNVSAKWDFSNKEYLNICKKLNFSKADYKELNKGFNIKYESNMSKEVIMCEKGENRADLSLSNNLETFIWFILTKFDENRIKNIKYDYNYFNRDFKLCCLEVEYDNIYTVGNKDEEKFKVYYDVYLNIEKFLGYKRYGFEASKLMFKYKRKEN